MSRIVRRVVTAPASVPRWLRPRLSREARLQLAVIQLQKLRDVDRGEATEDTLWDMVRDAITWDRVAELVDAGHEEMRASLRVVTQMVEHFGRTGCVEFSSQAQADAARLAAAHMEDLAGLVDLDTAQAAARYSEERVNAMRARQKEAA